MRWDTEDGEGQPVTLDDVRRGDWIRTRLGGVGQVERRTTIAIGKHTIEGFVVRLHFPRETRDFVPLEDAVILGLGKGMT